MAEKPSLPKQFDPDTYYRVQLKQPAQLDGRTLSPAKTQWLPGSSCEAIRDALYSVEAVRPDDQQRAEVPN